MYNVHGKFLIPDEHKTFIPVAFSLRCSDLFLIHPMSARLDWSWLPAGHGITRIFTFFKYQPTIAVVYDFGFSSKNAKLLVTNPEKGMMFGYKISSR